MNIVFYFLFLFFSPNIIITQTNDDILPLSDPEFSHSLIILNDTNYINIGIKTTPNRGMPAHIDWNQIPDIGFPKNEVHTIKIIRKAEIHFSNDNVILSPSVWRFEAESWSLDYKGSIPYLENLEFLTLEENTDLLTASKIEIAQNSMGYYQDKISRFPGFYQAMNQTSNNLVSSIFLISKQDNINIYQQTKKLDNEILENIQDQIVTSIENESTNDDKNDHLNNEEITSKKSHNTQNDQSIILDNGMSINTSIDKKLKNKLDNDNEY